MEKKYSAVFLESTDGDPISISGTADELLTELTRRKVSFQECLFFQGEPLALSDIKFES